MGVFMKNIDFYASELQYFDHMIPIWIKLPEMYRGTFYVNRDVLEFREQAKKYCRKGLPIKGNLTLVASYGDYCKTEGDVLFMEHGIGHTYPRDDGVIHASYAGGVNKERVVLFLNQHQHSLELNAKAYPSASQAIIGTPKMDSWELGSVKGRSVCFAFHWDCMVCHETRTAFYHYEEELKRILDMKDRGYDVWVHAHPRAFGKWQKFVSTRLRGHNVRFIKDFRTVMESIDVYVNDNSSTMYEFACLDKPVIVLNMPEYRRDVNLGLRFWEYPCGVSVDEPSELHSKILQTLDNPNEYKHLRDKVREDLYPYWHHSAKRASEVIVGFLERETE